MEGFERIDNITTKSASILGTAILRQAWDDVFNFGYYISGKGKRRAKRHISTEDMINYTDAIYFFTGERSDLGLICFIANISEETIRMLFLEEWRNSPSRKRYDEERKMRQEKIEQKKKEIALAANEIQGQEKKVKKATDLLKERKMKALKRFREKLIAQRNARKRRNLTAA